MTGYLAKNAFYAERIKTVVKTKYEPVAVRLIRQGEEFPGGYAKPEKQMSHCQAVMRARKGERITLKTEDHSCRVGSSALGMGETPDKVADGTFHYDIGAYSSPDAAAKTISMRLLPKEEIAGEILVPLKDADFEPDVVLIIDTPERIYWFIPLSTASEGGRMEFNTSAFQCTCEDITTIPMMTQRPNISLGCYGSRRRTDMGPEEMALGIPYGMIEGFMPYLEKYESGIMVKAKRD